MQPKTLSRAARVIERSDSKLQPCVYGKCAHLLENAQMLRSRLKEPAFSVFLARAPFSRSCVPYISPMNFTFITAAMCDGAREHERRHPACVTTVNQRTNRVWRTGLGGLGRRVWPVSGVSGVGALPRGRLLSGSSNDRCGAAEMLAHATIGNDGTAAQVNCVESLVANRALHVLR